MCARLVGTGCRRRAQTLGSARLAAWGSPASVFGANTHARRLPRPLSRRHAPRPPPPKGGDAQQHAMNDREWSSTRLPTRRGPCVRCAGRVGGRKGVRSSRGKVSSPTSPRPAGVAGLMMKRRARIERLLNNQNRKEGHVCSWGVGFCLSDRKRGLKERLNPS